jgi:hypothetical protein
MKFYLDFIPVNKPFVVVLAENTKDVIKPKTILCPFWKYNVTKISQGI